MVISEISIRRPVFATVVNLVIVLVGLVAYDRLTLREYPNIDLPIVTVTTTYQGASASIVESQVTTPLEDSLSGIEGVDYINSISRSELSQVSVVFSLDRDADGAANDVRDRVSRVRGLLPDEVDEPIVMKTEADATPMMFLGVSSDVHDPMYVTEMADRLVKDRLQTLPGVSDVGLFGAKEYSMRIWLDRNRLAAYELTPQEVESAIRQQNIEVPSGRIESADREFTVVAETDLQTPEEFRRIIVKETSDYLVRLGDVAHVELGPRDERRLSRFQGKPAQGIGVIKQATANPLDVSRAVRTELPLITEGMPEGMRVDLGYDTTIFVDASIRAVYTHIGEAIALVTLVIFLFLRNFRATLIPLVTVPVSLIGACAIMYFVGFTLNTLTLLAIVLAIGLVVDDAIVMLENVHRHIEEGMTPRAAAFRGAREIGFAILAMTLTLAAVFAPMAFTEGRTGRLFTEFALTLAAAVLVSGFTALTLSPMMCSVLLSRDHVERKWSRTVEGWITALVAGYRRLLSWALHFRVVVLSIALFVGVAGVFLFVNLKSELTPVEDRGFVLGMGFGPEGATIDYMDRYARQMEAVYAQIPEIGHDHYMMIVGWIGVNSIITFLPLDDWSERERLSPEIVRDMGARLGRIPGILAFPVLPPSLGQPNSTRPIEFVLQTTGSYRELEEIVEAMLDRARANPGLTGVDTDLKLNKPELSIEVDRDKAASLGVNVGVIGRTLETMLGGRNVTRFKRAGEQYDVVVQVADDDRQTPQDLTSIFVRARAGDMVQLSNLVRVEETVAPKELNHFNKMRSAKIMASITEGYTLGEALDFLETTLKEVAPPTTRFDYAGVSREFRESASELYLIFVLALVFIYLVLAAQFESFMDPFIIMLSVPFAMTGGLLALTLTGGSINVYSQIGLITLVGLITKHGILIVDFANKLQEEGRAIKDAAIEAAGLRLRPILMTTGAMTLGAVPLATAFGAGAESRQQIGWVVVGGILLGTFFTLFVVPAVYTYLARSHHARDEAVQAAPLAAPSPGE